jgi:hypothetical protein
MTKKILYKGSNSTHIALLELIIRSVADRRNEAIFFYSLSILFRSESKEKDSKRMMQNIIKEVRIIQPLSRRAFAMYYDIAMKNFAAGCESEAQEVLDYTLILQHIFASQHSVMKCSMNLDLHLN